MSIVRAPRPSSQFLMVRNEVARDARLSFRARGLLVAILSRPDDWRTTSTDLSREGKEGREAIRTALKELEEHGYIERRRWRDEETGQWRYELRVYDSPDVRDLGENAGRPSAQKPDAGEPGAGSPGAGNLGDIQRTETKNRDEETTRASHADAERLANLLADRVAEYVTTRPTVTKAWVTTIDRMIRLDDRTPQQIENCIMWATQDEFWHRNVLSPTKLRANYERLRLDARDSARKRRPTNADTMDTLLNIVADLEAQEAHS